MKNATALAIKFLFSSHNILDLVSLSAFSAVIILSHLKATWAEIIFLLWFPIGCTSNIRAKVNGFKEAGSPLFFESKTLAGYVTKCTDIMCPKEPWWCSG